MNDERDIESVKHDIEKIKTDILEVKTEIKNTNPFSNLFKQVNTTANKVYLFLFVLFCVYMVGGYSARQVVEYCDSSTKVIWLT